jgi:error-prone DNA polymerase
MAGRLSPFTPRTHRRFDRNGCAREDKFRHIEMSAPRFAHLSVRTTYSLREGAIRPSELAAATRKLGMDAAAITDTNGLYGAVRFAQACRIAEVKPIYGARLTVENTRAPRRQLVTLLARTQDGYTNLCRIITAAHMRGERGDPCATIDDVAAHADGLYVLLGSESEPGRAAVAGRSDEADALLRRWSEVAEPRHLYIEVRNWLEPGSRIEVLRLLRLADARRVPAVATNAARILAPADAFVADALDAMRKLVPLAAHHRENTNSEAYLKSPAEMAALFRGRPDLIRNAARIAQECHVDIGLGQLHLPHYPLPRGVSANSLLARRCWEGVARRGMPHTTELRRRLDSELAMIAKLGFAGYFLTVADIVERIKAKGIRVACRGSAAGSLVCYLTGTSEVDPIRHHLLFERFVNPYRNELPDVDLDVESARREEVYADILGAFTDEQVACVAMVDTYRARGAIREVGKALGYPEGEVDLVAKSFPHTNAGEIRSALDHLPELKRTTLARGQLDLLFGVAERLDSFPRHMALHPSGILITPHDLVTRSPLERSANGFRMIQFDKDDVEALGLLKLDVIGIRMLSSMTHAAREIQRATGERIDLDRIARDDEPTFELIRSSRTLGCFQIESPGQRELLGKFQPTRWSDLIIDISLFRPGPVRSDMISPFLNRLHGFANPSYAHQALRDFLQESFGVVVFHEQVMLAIAAVTGCELGYADQVRRELEDEEKLPLIEDWFYERGLERGWTRREIDPVWHEVSSFAAFGFCKAHAAAFAVPTYQSAWLKANHPAAFFSGVLTHEPGMYPRRAILDDARHEGVPILPLDVNRSEREYTIEPLPHETSAFGVRIGFMHVDGISAGEIEEVLGARARKPFDGLVDFCRRTNLSRPTVENLAHVGALDAFGGRRDLLLKVRELWERDKPKPEPAQVALAVQEEPVSWGLRPYSDAERVRAELEVTGLDVSRHVVSFYERLFERIGVTRARDLRSKRQGERVMVAGVKVASQTPAVRSGQRIIFLTLDDSYGLVDVTVFESVQEQCAWTAFHSWLIVARGTLHKSGARGVSINCERAWDLPTLAQAEREGTLDARALWTEGVEEIEAYERERRASQRARRVRPPTHPQPPARPAADVRPIPSRAPAADAPRKLWHASSGSAGA